MHCYALVAQLDRVLGYEPRGQRFESSPVQPFQGNFLGETVFSHKFPFGPLDTNAVLFACKKTKKAAVIDPAQGSADTLLQKASSLGFTIEKILLTHSHWDHIVDVYALLQKISVPVYIHPLDAPNLEKPGSDGLPLFFPIHGVKPTHLVHDGEKVSIGELICEVIHTPGHSPGSVCYHLKEQKALFAGDTLFQGSCGNLHLPTGNAEQMWVSLKKLATLDPNTRVIPGHGPDTLIKYESWLGSAKEIFAN